MSFISKFATKLEVFKFAIYVFIPIGTLAYVNTPEYQNTQIKPYTLFPSSGKKEQSDLFPSENETKEEWKQRLADTAHIRRRAKEIYDENKLKKKLEATAVKVDNDQEKLVAEV